MASLHPSSKKKKECREIISKPKIHQISIESRNYIGQGRNQKLFQQVIESFMPSHYALYIYVFYCIVHDNGMPSGKSSNIAVV